MHDHHRSNTGVLFALSAFAFWGITPLYYRPIDHIGAGEILAHRILWTVVLIPILLIVLRRFGSFGAALKSRRTVGLLCLSGAMIVGNWFIFVWAVTHGQVLETSLGYFINPLFSIFLGVLFLGERLRPAQQLALVLAAVGVMYLVIDHGSLPWVAIALPLLFGLYGLIRKHVNVDPLSGLWIETLTVVPFALVYVAYLFSNGEAHFGGGHAQDTTLLLLGGPVTIFPLTMFAAAARRIDLSTLGFTQYVAPSLTFLLAIFFFHEGFGRTQLITFSFIWVSLAIFALDGLRFNRVGARQAEIAEVVE